MSGGVSCPQTHYPRDIISMDHSGLVRSCHLLKACVFETYRIAKEPTSIRYVVRPITTIDGNLGHTLKLETLVSAAQSLISHNSLTLSLS